jgi:hypothetical protein
VLEASTPIKDLTSAAVIPVLRLGSEPSLIKAGVPESVILDVFALIALACDDVIVLVFPASAVEEVEPNCNNVGLLEISVS